MPKLGEDFWGRFMAVIDWEGTVVFTGRQDACYEYLRSHLRQVMDELIMLAYAERDSETGEVTVGRLASFSL